MLPFNNIYTDIICYLSIYPKRFIIRNRFMHLWRLGSPKSPLWAGRLKIQENQWCRASQKTVGWRICFCPGRPLFCSIWPSGDWIRLTHAMEGNVLYPKFIHLNVDVFQKHPPNWCIKWTITMGNSSFLAYVSPNCLGVLAYWMMTYVIVWISWFPKPV